MKRWIQLKTVTKYRVLAMLTPLILLAALACEGIEAELVRGILQNVDTVNGEITITTNDGKTITLHIDTAAGVETASAGSTLPSSFQTLEPGTSVEVELDDDGRGVRGIVARLAQAKGTVVAIEGDEVTIESSRGQQATVQVTERTRIRLEDNFPGQLADLTLGSEVKIKFDPVTRVAFKIDTEDEEAKIEGSIVEAVADAVTVETKQGRSLTLAIGDRTRVELGHGLPGTYADLRVGDQVEVKFDPFTRTAYKIEVEEQESEITGVIAQLDGDHVTIATEQGRSLTLAVGDQTRVEFSDDFPGTYDDLLVGHEVEVRFDPVALTAYKIEVEDQESKIEGVIAELEDDQVTINTERGRSLTLAVGHQTRVELADDFPGTYEDLQVGDRVEARFDPVARAAFRIEVKD